MNKITAYKIVGSTTASEFEKAINDLIKEGWQPYGSPLIEIGREHKVLQALVRYEKED